MENEEQKQNIQEELDKLSRVNKVLQAVFYITVSIAAILWTFKLLPR